MASEKESVRVNAVVSESQRDRWKDHVEESGEYSSLSDLIRTGVEREIQGRDTGSDEAESIQTGEILDKLDELGSRFNSVESRLSSLESESQTDPEIGQLATEVYQILPDMEPGSKEWKGRKQELNQQLSLETEEAKEEYNAWKGTIEGLSNALDAPEYMIEDAIEKLQNDTNRVRQTDDGRLFKEV